VPAARRLRGTAVAPVRPRGAGRAAERGDALVETALVAPVLLALVLGTVGVSRVTHAQFAVGVVAREAARSGALAGTPGAAVAQATARGQEVARGYGLANASLELRVDASGFGRGGQVRASARYTVALADLPLMGWVEVPVSAAGAEWVDPYRSGVAGGRR
jgi:Flp pilus assembly protein TadG